MFKEAFITVLCFTGIYVILCFLLQKNELLAKRLIAGALALTLLLNIGYNIHTFFPAFVLDGMNYLGDADGNLFIYNEESEFTDQILFPALQNRTVLIDESAQFYNLFLRTFSGAAEELSLSENDCAMLLSTPDIFSFTAPLHIVELANYAFPDHAKLPEMPVLYLDEDGLAGEDTLIAISDDAGNLYLFAEKTYLEVTGHE